MNLGGILEIINFKNSPAFLLGSVSRKLLFEDRNAEELGTGSDTAHRVTVVLIVVVVWVDIAGSAEVEIVGDASTRAGRRRPSVRDVACVPQRT